MKYRLIVLSAFAVFTGCKTAVMKSTPFYEGGNAECAERAADRVNLWPLVYWSNPAGSVAWPLVTFSDEHFALRPIYSQWKQSGKNGPWDEFNFARPLMQADMKHGDHWLFPIWLKSGNVFVSPVYAQGCDVSNSWWAVPFALSGGKERWEDSACYRSSRFLLRLGGSSECQKKKVNEGHWWVFPFVDHKWSNRQVNKKYECREETSLPALFTGWTMRNGDLSSLFSFPLFSWRNDGSWITVLGGQFTSNGTTNTFVTPLFGLKSGRRTGGWAFPVWEAYRDADFDKALSYLDLTTLLADFKITVHTNKVAKGELKGCARLYGNYITKVDKTTVLFQGINHVVTGENQSGTATNRYVFTEHRKNGNELLLNCESKRKVTFDLNTRAKLSDTEESETSFLLLLYRSKQKHSRMRDGEQVRHRVLWRLWDWKEVDGNVSLDVFPGLTYDRRKDGYTKTSFLWRLFRDEKHGSSKTSIDFLFVPIWRD